MSDLREAVSVSRARSNERFAGSSECLSGSQCFRRLGGGGEEGAVSARSDPHPRFVFASLRHERSRKSEVFFLAPPPLLFFPPLRTFFILFLLVPGVFGDRFRFSGWAEKKTFNLLGWEFFFAFPRNRALRKKAHGKSGENGVTVSVR